MAKPYLSPKATAVGVPFAPDFKTLLRDIAEHMGIGGNLKSFTFGSTTPDVEDQDKPWLKTNLAGVPLGWFYFDGSAWRPIEPIGKIVNYQGVITEIPVGWRLCDGVGTYLDKDDATIDIPDLRNKFIPGAGATYAMNEEGGSASTVITTDNLPSAPVTFRTAAAGSHRHVLIGRDLVGSAIPGITAIVGAGVTTRQDALQAIQPNGLHTHFVSVSLGGGSGSGGDTAIDTIPPFFALAKIIYTAT